MKLLMLSATIACEVLAFVSPSVCQEAKGQPERLHFSMPFPEGHKVIFELVASSAQRVSSRNGTESVLQLRGDVEVTMITCRPAGNTCDKSPVVLHADAVDYNERTGKIDTHGDVHLVLVEPISKTTASN